MKHLAIILSTLLPLALQPVQAQENITQILAQTDTITNPTRALSLLRPFKILEGELDSKTQLKLYSQLGIYYGQSLSIDSSTLYLKKALKVAEDIQDTIASIQILNALGNVVQTQNIVASQGYYEEALAQAKTGYGTIYLKWQANILGNIAGIYFQNQDLNGALRLSRESILLATKSEDTLGIITAYLRLGYCYSQSERLDSALIVNQKATQLLEIRKDSLQLNFQYFNLAKIYEGMGQDSEAIEYYKKSEALATELGIVDHQIGSMNGLGNIYIKTGRFGKSKVKLLKGLHLGKEKELKVSQKASLKLLYNLAIKEEDYQAALDYLTEYHAVDDALKTDESNQKLKEFEVKYNVAKKDMELAELALAQQQAMHEIKWFRLKIVALISLLVFATVMFFFYSRYQKQKHLLQEQLLNEEIGGLRLKLRNIMSEIKLDEVSLDYNQLKNELPNSLSDREIEILQIAITNKTNAEIAEEVHLSVNTVKYHLKNIYNKIGVSSRLEAREVLSKVH
ncbi:MAG: tetratricopeptide repeat protein [Reichenbachiella sp.]|uniref:tetratricopeptide repeat protein n=1 Tax=Reichenbachiella sp. TaxID=2184521 RepID=UPI003297BA14